MMLDMPFETVKLDSSLISNITRGERKCHTVKLLVELLHNSGLIVVAEGIEAEKENQTAKELTIDMIQGFYHARPMPGDAYVEFLKERKTTRSPMKKNKRSFGRRREKKLYRSLKNMRRKWVWRTPELRLQARKSDLEAAAIKTVCVFHGGSCCIPRRR